MLRRLMRKGLVQRKKDGDWRSAPSRYRLSPKGWHSLRALDMYSLRALDMYRTAGVPEKRA